MALILFSVVIALIGLFGCLVVFQSIKRGRAAARERRQEREAVQNASDEETVYEAYTLPQNLTYTGGVFANMFFVGTTLGVARILGAPLIVQLSLVGIAFAYFGYMGILSIDIAHRGVLTLLNKRLEFIDIEEGTVWLLPSPLMGAVAVNMQERTDEVALSEVPAIDHGLGEQDDDETEEGEVTIVQMIVDTVLQWRVVDPYRVLDIGENVIQNGLKELVRSTVRDVAAGVSDVKLVQMRRELGEQVDEQSSTTEARWGIEIDQVLVPRVTWASANLREAYERIRVEQQQRRAEVEERDHLIESTNIIAGQTGVTAGDAMEAFQAERGKMTRHGFRISGGGEVLTAIAGGVASLIEKNTEGGEG